MKKLRGAGAALAVAALVSLAVGTAVAHGAETVAPRPARVLFEQAELNFNLGNFNEALADYRAAYQLEPLPGFLFNMGQCYRNLGDYERARFAYLRYVTLEPYGPNRAAVDGLIAEMSRLIETTAAPPASGPRQPVSILMGAARPPRVTDDKPAALALARTATRRFSSMSTVSLLGPPSAPRDGPPGPPLYHRWWFWSGLGTVVAASLVASLVLSRR